MTAILFLAFEFQSLKFVVSVREIITAFLTSAQCSQIFPRGPRYTVDIRLYNWNLGWCTVIPHVIHK